MQIGIGLNTNILPFSPRNITGSKPHYDDRSLRLLHCTFHFIIMKIIVTIGSTFSNHTNFLIKSIVQHISQGETLTVTEYYSLSG